MRSSARSASSSASEASPASRATSASASGDAARGTLTAAYVVDEARNNSYQAFLDGGLAAALAAGTLRSTPEAVTGGDGCWNLVLRPYSVVLLELAGARATAFDAAGAGDLPPPRIAGALPSRGGPSGAGTGRILGRTRWLAAPDGFWERMQRPLFRGVGPAPRKARR